MAKFNLGDKVVLSELGLKYNNDKKGMVGEVYGIFKDGLVTVAFSNFFYERFTEDYFELYVELLNGKFVCIKECVGLVTVGKVYEFKDGFSEYDDGDKMPLCNPIKNLEDLNDRILSKFEPYKEELLNGKFICTYGLGGGTTTAGKVYEFKDGFSKYNTGNKMPNSEIPIKNLEELNRVMASKFEPYVEEELLNGKFVCIKGFKDLHTAGKVYEFKDGFSKYDNGKKSPTYTKPFNNLEELNGRLVSKFIPFME